VSGTPRVIRWTSASSRSQHAVARCRPRELGHNQDGCGSGPRWSGCSALVDQRSPTGGSRPTAGIVAGVLREVEVGPARWFVSGVGLVRSASSRRLLRRYCWASVGWLCDRMAPPACLRRAVGGRRHGPAWWQPWSVLPSSRNSSKIFSDLSERSREPKSEYFAAAGPLRGIPPDARTSRVCWIHQRPDRTRSHTPSRARDRPGQCPGTNSGVCMKVQEVSTELVHRSQRCVGHGVVKGHVHAGA